MGTFCGISRWTQHSQKYKFSFRRNDLVFDAESLHSLVASTVLGGPAGVALTGIGGGGVAGESLLAEHGVAVVEEQNGVTGALDRRDLSSLWALAGGAVREPA